MLNCLFARDNCEITRNFLGGLGSLLLMERCLLAVEVERRTADRVFSLRRGDAPLIKKRSEKKVRDKDGDSRIRIWDDVVLRRSKNE